MIHEHRTPKALAALASLALGLTLGVAGCNNDGPGGKDDKIVNESGPVDTKPGEPGVQPPGTDAGVVNANPNAESDVNKSTTTGPDQGGGPPAGVPPAGDTSDDTGQAGSGDAGKAGPGGDQSAKPE
jgi:hypothetical protein